MTATMQEQAASRHETIVHGTAIALAGRAALIRGPSGAGKSDLALRCITLPPTPFWDTPVQLIADDRVILKPADDTVVAFAPEPLTGLLEVRQIGIIPVPATSGPAIVRLVVDLAGAASERFPDPCPETTLCGVKVRQLGLTPFEASAPLKLLLALAEYPDRGAQSDIS